MTKRIFAIIFISAVGILSLLVSATFAWFTDTASTDLDTVKTGKFEIAVIIDGNIVEGEVISEVENILPAQIIEKTVSVKNIGDSPAWVRIKATQEFKDASGKALPYSIYGEDGLLLGELGEGWTYSDGYYYYSKAVEPDEATAKFIEEFTVNPKLGNEYALGVARLIFNAESVQSNYNGETVFEARGWE